MRLFFSEFPPNYQRYHFPYQVLALREKKDNPHNLYLHGFLPFRSKKNLYYLARSTRVNLQYFKPSSENRRILKKTQKFTFSLQPLDQFNYTPQVQKFSSDYIKATCGKATFPTAAIRKIFTNSNYTHVFTFTLAKSTKDEASNTNGRNPIGYVVTAINHSFLHYAHPFYDLKFQKDNLGIGMMTQVLTWAQRQHKTFVYLGTCYTPNSLYKTQFPGFEFFTGYSWSSNLKQLKTLIKEQLENQYLLQDKKLLKNLGFEKPKQLIKAQGIPAKLS